MRITFLMPADDLTGGNRVVGMYAKHLRERGHEVLVVSNAPDRPSLREHARALRDGRWREVRARRYPPPGHIALSGVPHKVLERPRPMTAADLPDADVLIATWWETAVWMQQMPPSKGRKVHLVQGYEVWAGGDVKARVHAALRLPNRKIAISASLARDIEAELGDLVITVVPNAVDLVQFDAPPRPRGEPPTVGFIYAHAQFKGADICIRACELARRELPGLRVLAFGGDLPSFRIPGCVDLLASDAPLPRYVAVSRQLLLVGPDTVPFAEGRPRAARVLAELKGRNAAFVARAGDSIDLFELPPPR